MKKQQKATKKLVLNLETIVAMGTDGSTIVKISEHFDCTYTCKMV